MSPLRWSVSDHAVERFTTRIEPSMRPVVAREVLARFPESRAVTLVGRTTDGCELYRERRRPNRAEYLVRWDFNCHGHAVRVLVTVLDPTEQPLIVGREGL